MTPPQQKGGQRYGVATGESQGPTDDNRECRGWVLIGRFSLFLLPLRRRVPCDDVIASNAERSASTLAGASRFLATFAFEGVQCFFFLQRAALQAQQRLTGLGTAYINVSHGNSGRGARASADSGPCAPFPSACSCPRHLAIAGWRAARCACGVSRAKFPPKNWCRSEPSVGFFCRRRRPQVVSRRIRPGLLEQFITHDSLRGGGGGGAFVTASRGSEGE